MLDRKFKIILWTLVVHKLSLKWRGSLKSVRVKNLKLRLLKIIISGSLAIFFLLLFILMYTLPIKNL